MTPAPGSDEYKIDIEDSEGAAVGRNASSEVQKVLEELTLKWADLRS